MNIWMAVFAVFILVMGVMGFEMMRVPAGLKRESYIKDGRIYSRTSSVARAPVSEAVHLLQNDWSWWKKAHAGPMKDLGNGRKEFYFHPIRFLDLFQVQPCFLVRFERTESLPDGGVCIHASISGDFEGPAEYIARPVQDGTAVELAWCGAKVNSPLRFAPRFLTAAVHCWRERIGVQGLRDRLQAGRSGV